jgi:hypothetical protein
MPLVLSAVALAVALLGSTPLGEAAKRIVLPRKSVGAAQLKNDAVTSIKVKDASLLARDFKRGQLPSGPQGPTGPQGVTGPQGPTGLQGPTGPPGPTQGQSTATTGTHTDTSEIGPGLEITLSSPGKLFVFGRVKANVTCAPATFCNRHYELYVDGERVPGTLAEASAAVTGQTFNEDVTVFGTKSVGSGTHTVHFRAGNSATVTSSLDVGPNVGAIALGG